MTKTSTSCHRHACCAYALAGATHAVVGNGYLKRCVRVTIKPVTISAFVTQIRAMLMEGSMEREADFNKGNRLLK